MSDEDDRPKPRTRPITPDPSEGQDPVVPAAAPAPPAAVAAPPALAASATPVRRTRGPGTFAQLNTRVHPMLTDLVEYVSNERGWSKRDVVEHALKKAFAAELKAMLASKEAS